MHAPFPCIAGRILAAAAGVAIGWTQAARASEPVDAPDGWEKVAQVQFLDARRAFEARLQADPADHDARIGLAVALLNVQPRQSANIERALALLDGVRSAGRDEQVIEAIYLLARIHQLHRDPADPYKAVELFDGLLAAHPDHPLAQMGFVKAAMLRLYVLDEASPAATFATLEQRAAHLSDPTARRDFHLTMAAAASRLRLGDAAALRHLRAADAVGLAKRNTAGNLYIRAATRARALGQVDLAEAYERRFLAEFPRDFRAYTIRQRLGAPATQPAEATP